MAIILIGFMGAGKTSVGKALSKQLGLPFVDLDKAIENKVNMSIPDYFSAYSEQAFRELEHQALVAYQDFPGIVSTGGGCIETPENRELLQGLNQVIYLDASMATIWHRLNQDQTNSRPLADNHSFDQLQARYDRRLPYYRNCSQYCVSTDHLTTAQVVNKIIDLLQLK